MEHVCLVLCATLSLHHSEPGTLANLIFLMGKLRLKQAQQLNQSSPRVLATTLSYVPQGKLFCL